MCTERGFSMDYTAIWNDICFHAHKNRNAEEKVFQAAMEFMFEKLGWSFRKDIETQIPVRINTSRDGILDILIKNNNEKAYVVELKRVGNNISQDDTDQLRRYMRILKSPYGVLLGITLQMYYEPPSSSEPAVKVCDIQLKENSESGIECIEVLSIANFTLDRLNTFCEKCLLDPDKYIEKKKATSSKSSEKESKSSGKKSYFGPLRSVSYILEKISQPSDKKMYVGKRRIREELDGKRKDEINDMTFYFWHEKSKTRTSETSWLEDTEFKDIYDNAP
jgi:hypothetical protein